VNARDESGCTALHYAAQSGLKRCVEYLLAHGADAYAQVTILCDIVSAGNNPFFLELWTIFNQKIEENFVCLWT
jgi:ankyrin repeat protein